MDRQVGRKAQTPIRTDTQTDKHSDRQTSRKSQTPIRTDTQTDKHSDRQTSRQTYRRRDLRIYRTTYDLKKDGHTERQTHRQTNRQIDKQIGRQAYIQTYIQTYSRQTYIIRKVRHTDKRLILIDFIHAFILLNLIFQSANNDWKTKSYLEQLVFIAFN